MVMEEKILGKALEMFNRQGIEYTGIRELAAALGIRPSNITYYFPTKDDLVLRLSNDLNQLNSGLVIEYPELSLSEFLHMFRCVFQNHVKYRCLLLSFVHIMEQNKKLAERYKQTKSDRSSTLKHNIQTLLTCGYLEKTKDTDIDFLVANIALIVRFWISEASVSLRHLKTDEQIEFFVQMIAQCLQPHLSAKGMQQLNSVF